MTACLSDLRLDELLANELASDDAAAAARHLGDCAQCRAREHELTADRARFRAAILPLRRRRRTASTLGITAAIASAAALAIVARPPADATRTKGHARLGVIVVHGAAHRAGPGELARPGDTLSYVVTTDRPAYVTIVSRDAAGRITTYVPAERVPAGSDLQLSTATVLDDTIGPEQLYGVFCVDPTPADALRAALDREPPAGCVVDHLAIEKVR